MHKSQWQRAAADFGHKIPAPFILIFALILMQLSSGTAKIIMTPENAQGLAFLRMLIGALLLWLVIRPKVSLMSFQQWKDVSSRLACSIRNEPWILLLFEIPSAMSWLAIAAVTASSIGATLGKTSRP